jgi:hypothetical protein
MLAAATGRRTVRVALDPGRLAPVVLDPGRLALVALDLGRLAPIVLDPGRLARLEQAAEHLTCHASPRRRKKAVRWEGADTPPMQTLFQVPKSKWQKALDGRSCPTSASIIGRCNYPPQPTFGQAGANVCDR